MELDKWFLEIGSDKKYLTLAINYTKVKQWWFYKLYLYRLVWQTVLSQR